MFVPTEGIGSAVAKVSRETGVPVLNMTFHEDRCVVEFAITAMATTTTKKPKVAPPPVLSGATYPEGPWEKTSIRGPHGAKQWKCGDVSATTKQLAESLGLPTNVVLQRLYNTKFITTRHSRSKFEKVNVAKRMTLGD